MKKVWEGSKIACDIDERWCLKKKRKKNERVHDSDVCVCRQEHPAISSYIECNVYVIDYRRR